MKTEGSVYDHKEEIVSKWFDALWGRSCDLAAIDALASEDVSLQYSMTKRIHGLLEVKTFIIYLRRAFPDLEFRRTSDFVTDRNVVVTHWDARGTHTGPAFADFNVGPLPDASGRRLQLCGMNATRLSNGMIVEEAIWSRPKSSRLHVVQGGLP